MDSMERQLKIENIITAHQLRIISFEEASTRLKEVFSLDLLKLNTIYPN